MTKRTLRDRGINFNDTFLLLLLFVLPLFSWFVCVSLYGSFLLFCSRSIFCLIFLHLCLLRSLYVFIFFYIPSLVLSFLIFTAGFFLEHLHISIPLLSYHQHTPHWFSVTPCVQVLSHSLLSLPPPPPPTECAVYKLDVKSPKRQH